jgi:5'-methylthioadenosine phosphorylase
MDASAPPSASVAIIGGTGLYQFFDESQIEAVEVHTPYGAPSAPVAVGTIAGLPVAFLPRHGAKHEFGPHSINYRANMWALRSLGVRQILAPCAVGGLDPESTPPGAIVVPDQLVDRTSGRVQTFSEHGATHVPFADPYCPRLSSALTAAGQRTDEPMLAGGTMVVIEGPRFSTRAESRWYAAQGWQLVNMTGHPEAVLAREMRICYSALALVTDLDAGVNAGEGVSETDVFALFAANLGRLRTILTAAIAELPDPEGCTCSTWADDLELAYEVPR